MASRIRLAREDYLTLVEQVLQRDHFRCRSCKSTFRVSAHHIIFRSDSGPDTSSNLVSLCGTCHDAVHGKISNNFVIIMAADGNEDTVPNADVGLRFRRLKQIGKRLRWRNTT